MGSRHVSKELWNFLREIKYLPANIYLFEVNNRNTRKMCEVWSKLTIKPLLFAGKLSFWSVKTQTIPVKKMFLESDIKTLR